MICEEECSNRIVFLTNRDVFSTKKARDKYEDEKNKQFDYSMFHFMNDISNTL